MALPASASAALPDLVSDAPQQPRLQVYSSAGQPQERLLLRFDGYVHNAKGAGPLEILATIRTDDPKTDVDEGDIHPPETVTQVVEDGPDIAMPVSTLVFEDALPGTANEDGHNHWHVQRASGYSLVAAGSDALVAPAEKVGFCMLDSEWLGDPVTEREPLPGFGGSSCIRGRWDSPEVDTIRMGVSPNFRDVYGSNTMFQWVDVSETPPGPYRLSAQIDPNNLITEKVEANPPAYRPVVVEGYRPIQRPFKRESGTESVLIGLGSEKFELKRVLAAPEYKLVDPPDHGTVSLSSAWQAEPSVVYTPADGSDTPDSFTYAVRETGAQFPRLPSVNSVTIAVGEKPTIGIGETPQRMLAETSIALTSAPSAESWTASAGRIAGGRFYAPKDPGPVTITAVSPKGAVDRRTIEVVAPPKPEPAPEPPGTPSGDSLVPTPDPLVPKPPVALPRRAIETVKAARIGRFVAVTAVAGQAGRLTFSLRKDGKRIKGCVMTARAGAGHTCRVKRPKDERSLLKAVVVLRKPTGRTVSRTVAVPAAKRARASAHRH